MKYQILHGDNRETLKTIPDNSIDAIVTDPPYGIDFLGKAWDANTGALETYQECLRVLKPGGHILAFSAARTYHHLAITLEQAGFEIRDQIMWIYSSGFPKSQDIGKSIDRQSGKASHKAELAEVKSILKQLYAESGKNTAEISRECGFNAGGYLKTDFKDKGWANNLPKDDKWITLKSVLGCGDEYDDYFITTPQLKVGEKSAGCFDQEFDNYTIGARSRTVDITASQTDDGRTWSGWGTQLKPAHEPIALARKPIKLSIARNCQVHGVGALNIDATRIEGLTEKELNWTPQRQQAGDNTEIGTFGASGLMGQEISMFNEKGRFPSNVIGEISDYQKYFYCPKVSRRERHIGHETPPPMFGDVAGAYGPDGNRMAVGLDARSGNTGNNHPTVKPIELMKYLIKLITPPGGVVLDPFNGSGSTGCAAVELGMTYIGCELDERYVDIADKRIRAWYEHCNPTMYNQLFEQAA
jgi:DNA modification methylase